MRFFVIIFFLISLYCSRTSSVQTSQESENPSPEELARQELFDPDRLRESFRIPPPSFKTYPKITPEKIQLGQFDISVDSATIDSTVSISGYRIQIFNQSSYVRANEAYLNALAAIFDEPVYMSFDQPYWKIRVGNFIQRKEAESFRIQRLRKLYPDSWVVQTKIYPYQIAPTVLLNDSLLYSDTSRTKIDTSAYNK